MRPSHLLLAGLLCLAAHISQLAANAASAWETPLKEQTNPAKLATLGERGANRRVNRIIFYLHQANQSGTSPRNALEWAFTQNGTAGLAATLTMETQLLNYDHAVNWGLLTEDNLVKLKHGKAPTITKGRYQGQATDVDHIIPISLAPEAGNSLANLEIQPSSVNRSKGASVGLREMMFARRLHEAGIIKARTLSAVRWACFRGRILPWLALMGLPILVWLSRRFRKRA